MRLLQIALWVLAVVLLSVAVRAGDLRIRWQPPAQGPTPTGYKVYTGLTDPPEGWTDVGLALEHDLTNLPDCTPNYLAVQAYNASSESLLSESISVYPRPTISDVTSDGTGTHTIHGNNFDTNVKVFVDAGNGFVQLPSGDVDRIDCTTIRIPSVPLFSARVANVVQPIGYGEPMDEFSMPWPAPSNIVVE
jgi:hypothetical protein